VDGYGEHALTCLRSGGETQRRHNELAYAIRDCVVEGGVAANCQTGHVFEAHKGRPADVWVPSHPRYRAGLAIDCTIVTASNRKNGAAAAAEERKRRKYKAEVERHPGLGFCAFAVDLDGNIGPEAWQMICAMAAAQIHNPSACRGNIAEAREWCIATLAHALVHGSVRQIRAYAERRARDAVAQRVEDPLPPPAPPPPSNDEEGSDTDTSSGDDADSSSSVDDNLAREQSIQDEEPRTGAEGRRARYVARAARRRAVAQERRVE
jgi:hypothetical protein